MPTTEELIESQARFLLKRVHPDVVGAYAPELKSIQERLVPLLEKIIKRPEDMRNWGNDIRKQYFRQGPDSTIQIAGLAPDKTTVRPPLTIPLKGPSTFIKMLHQYLDAGSVSQKYIDAPPFNPDVVYGAEEGEEEDHGDNAPGEAQLAARDLLRGIQEAETYNHLRAICVAIQIGGAHNARAYGVITALDIKIQSVITKEIEDNKLTDAEEHINDFPFDDAKVAFDLRNLLVQKRSRKDIALAPKHALEIEASKAQSIEDLRIPLHAANITNFPEGEQKRVLKSINGYAKKLLLDESERNASLEKYAKLLTDAVDFPFSDNEYALSVVDALTLRAKYFVLGHVWNSFSEQSLRSIEPELKKFPFSGESLDDIKMQIEIRERAIGVARASRQ